MLSALRSRLARCRPNTSSATAVPGTAGFIDEISLALTGADESGIPNSLCTTDF